jgi:hypothetical protein
MTAAELEWDMDSLEGRRAAVRHFVREHEQLAVDRPWDVDEEDLPEMYDDHRTQAEVDLTARYIDAGVIPETLDRRDSRGPKDLSFYGIKCHIEEWHRTLDLDREGLEERLQEIEEMSNPHADSRYSDGSSGQWRAWNRSLKGAILWLLGEHKEQQEKLKHE